MNALPTAAGTHTAALTPFPTGNALTVVFKKSRRQTAARWHVIATKKWAAWPGVFPLAASTLAVGPARLIFGGNTGNAPKALFATNGNFKTSIKTAPAATAPHLRAVSEA